MLPGDVSPCTDKNSTPRLKNTIMSLETVQQKYKQKLKGPVPQFFPEICFSFCLYRKDCSKLSTVVHRMCLENC